MLEGSVVEYMFLSKDFLVSAGFGAPSVAGFELVELLVELVDSLVLAGATDLSFQSIARL